MTEGAANTWDEHTSPAAGLQRHERDWRGLLQQIVQQD
jgi:hypothetical protein